MILPPSPVKADNHIKTKQNILLFLYSYKAEAIPTQIKLQRKWYNYKAPDGYRFEKIEYSMVIGNVWQVTIRYINKHSAVGCGYGSVEFSTKGSEYVIFRRIRQSPLISIFKMGRIQLSFS